MWTFLRPSGVKSVLKSHLNVHALTVSQVFCSFSGLLITSKMCDKIVAKWREYQSVALWNLILNRTRQYEVF